MPAKKTFVCSPTAGAPSSQPRDIGEQFELLEIIGEGGMGAVWRARDSMLGVEVAIKVIPPDSDYAVAAGRLVAEARAAARVRHPSAVRILRSGIHADGSPFIVMELLNGEPLDEVLDRGPLACAEACATLLPIIGAVSAAHDQGIVHRDVKPSNIFLHREGARVRPKLLDFGIAKQTRDVNTSMTLPGSIMGTPNYMAPEQACGSADVDHRADVWGLSAVLYELVSGRPPFDGENYNQVISAVLCEAPARPGGIDDWLWWIIARGLEKNQDDRWPTAVELGRQVAGWLIREGIEHDVTHTEIRSGSMRPEAMPATAPISGAYSTGTFTSGNMTLPPAPRIPSFAPAWSLRPRWVAAIGLLLGAGLTLTWLALPRDTAYEQVPRQASGGAIRVALSSSLVALPVRASAAASASVAPKPVVEEKPAHAPAASAPRVGQPVGPGRHGMPIPMKASF